MFRVEAQVPADIEDPMFQPDGDEGLILRFMLWRANGRGAARNGADAAGDACPLIGACPEARGTTTAPTTMRWTRHAYRTATAGSIGGREERRWVSVGHTRARGASTTCSAPGGARWPDGYR
jgi:hypothetical protein